jgi:hypothetical protein
VLPSGLSRIVSLGDSPNESFSIFQLAGQYVREREKSSTAMEAARARQLNTMNTDLPNNIPRFNDLSNKVAKRDFFSEATSIER